MIWHHNLKKKKKTGGKKRPYRTKRVFERGRHPVETVLNNTRRKKFEGRSGIVKNKLLSTNMVNVSDPNTGTTRRVEIIDVVRNPANTDYNRRGVITKGTIIRTEEGLARIVSRPGQNGALNAIIYEEEF
jgi:small subunit ribosomal protein S8e